MKFVTKEIRYEVELSDKELEIIMERDSQGEELNEYSLHDKLEDITGIWETNYSRQENVTFQIDFNFTDVDLPTVLGEIKDIIEDYIETYDPDLVLPSISDDDDTVPLSAVGSVALLSDEDVVVATDKDDTWDTADIESDEWTTGDPPNEAA